MIKTLALLALAVVSATAQASSPAPAGKGVIAPTIEPESSISYTNISLSMQMMSGNLSLFFGEIDLDYMGAALAFEYSPVKNFYVAASGSYNDVEASYSDSSGSYDSDLGEYWTGNVGVGTYIPITSNIHFVTEVGANYARAFYFGEDFSFYAMPHVRAKLGKFEAHTGVTCSSNDLSTSEFNGFLRLFYQVTRHLDLFGAGTLGLSDETRLQDSMGVNFGLRIKF
jgi:hypothetical protein